MSTQRQTFRGDHAQWMQDTRMFLLEQQPSIAGRIEWAELETLNRFGFTPSAAARSYLANQADMAALYCH